MNILSPSWPAPANVKAFTTLKNYNLNLAISAPQREQSCAKLRADFALPAEPGWLQQEHGGIVHKIEDITMQKNFHNHVKAQNIANVSKLPLADASYTQHFNSVCVVLTADCLPILLCDKRGTTVAAIHAGWRGQVAGIIEHTIQAIQVLGVDPGELLVWFGPAISSELYEVGADVYQEFQRAQTALPLQQIFSTIKTVNKFARSRQKQTAEQRAIEQQTVVPTDKWRLDLNLSAKYILCSCGVRADQIYGGTWCTYSDSAAFYSYRRAKDTGRLASLIWLKR